MSSSLEGTIMFNGQMVEIHRGVTGNRFAETNRVMRIASSSGMADREVQIELNLTENTIEEVAFRETLKLTAKRHDTEVAERKKAELNFENSLKTIQKQEQVIKQQNETLERQKNTITELTKECTSTKNTADNLIAQMKAMMLQMSASSSTSQLPALQKV